MEFDEVGVKSHYDPRHDERPPFPPRNQRRQSTFSIAIEALAGGFVIALLILGVKALLGPVTPLSTENPVEIRRDPHASLREPSVHRLPVSENVIVRKPVAFGIDRVSYRGTLRNPNKRIRI